LTAFPYGSWIVLAVLWWNVRILEKNSIRFIAVTLRVGYGPPESAVAVPAACAGCPLQRVNRRRFGSGLKPAKLVTSRIFESGKVGRTV
jgi:hypothetical protein